MVGQDLKSALQIRDLVQGIAADPDLDQMAKLFAFCVAAYRSSPQCATRNGERKVWIQAVGEMMIGGSEPNAGEENTAVECVRRVIANDIPRYQIELREHLTCPAPKTRGPRAGEPCGKNATRRWVERNPKTGEGTHIGYCSDHFTDSHRLRRAELLTQWEANGKPLPPANAGGILARHFTADWAKLYAWANPRQEPLPEGKPLTPPPPPRLTLIRGGGTAS